MRSIVGELLLDFFLPETDRGAVIQWVVMGAAWVVMVVVSWRWRREYRVFIYGLAMINLAWFAARTVH